MFKRQHDCNVWNTRYSGKRAGTKSLFNGKWYVVLRILGKQYLAHRVAWFYVTGEEPVEIDHQDSNGLNNKWGNLRNVTHRVNCKNTRMKGNNKSGVMGVHWCNRDERWVSRIFVNGKSKCLGYFKNKQDATDARLQAEKEYGFHDNHGKASSNT